MSDDEETSDRLEEIHEESELLGSIEDSGPDEDAMNLLDDVVENVESQDLYNPEEIASRDYADIESGISTNCIPLDLAVSRYGAPVGRQLLLRGGEGSGKTELGIELMADVHAQGGLSFVIDSEDTFSLSWAEKLGFQPEQNTMARPQSCEDAWELIRKVCNRLYEQKADDTPTLIFWDSVSDTATEDEVNEEIGTDSRTRGSHASLFSQSYRQMGSLLAETNTTLVLVVHPKVDPGASPYEDNLTYIARRPIDHNSSVIYHLEKGDTIGPSKAPRGQWQSVYIAKNKIAEPYRSVKYPVYFSDGIDNSQATFEFLKESPTATIDGETYEGLEGPNGGWYQLDLPGLPDDLRDESFRAKNFLGKVEEWTKKYEINLEGLIKWFVLAVLQPDEADRFATENNLKDDTEEESE